MLCRFGLVIQLDSLAFEILVSKMISQIYIAASFKTTGCCIKVIFLQKRNEKKRMLKLLHRSEGEIYWAMSRQSETSFK